MSLDPTAAVELRGISKTYGRYQAVKPLDLTIPRGSTFGLLGPNGAGKTTTIRMTLRIMEPDTGRIMILGQPQSQEGLDRIGYLPAERGVYKRMKVGALLCFFAELKGVPPRVARPRIAAWLERLELADRLNARVQELSTGMQQKVQFIGAIVHDPEIIILDEPFSGLDPLNQRVLREIITDLRRAGRTVIFSTHIMEHAERLCDQVCIIARGTKVADGPVAQVKREHGVGYVALRLDEEDPQLVARLRQDAAVRQLREQGTHLEIALHDAAGSYELLRQLVASNVRISRFEVTQPSLEQVFIERVATVGEEELVHA